MSAVSRKFTPRSSPRWIVRIESGSFAAPYTEDIPMQPRPIAETSRFPIVRRSMDPAFHQGRLIAQRSCAAEECDNVPGEELGLLSRHEMSAARHDRPAADVVQPFGPLARRDALRHELFSYGEPGGHRDIVIRAEFHAEPAVVVVIPHRWCD